MYVIKFKDLDEVNVVIAALGEMPLKVVHNVFQSIQQQIATQGEQPKGSDDTANQRS